MASALVPLANITVGAGVTSVTFSSIVGTYRDLILVCSNLTSSSGVTFAALRFNGDTTSTYNNVGMSGNGSATYSSSGNNNVLYLPYNGIIGTGDNANIITHIMDYSATDKHKTGLTRYNASASEVEAVAWRWASTSAITTVLVTTFGQPAWASGATFALYGVSA